MGIRDAWAALFQNPQPTTLEGDPAYHAEGEAVSMGPGEPAPDSPIGGEPRQWQYRPGWNLPTAPGEGKRIDFATLRQLADTFELLRKCIEIRKTEVQELEWDIVPSTSDKRKSREVRENEGDRIDEIKKFFLYPTDATFVDGERKGYGTFADLVGALMEDYLVVDALTIYPRPTLGGKLLSLDPIDGTTIKPLIDVSGRIPLPPEPAYQQFLYGIPRADFSRDELYYVPKLTRATSPYGFSHVEQILMHINLALRNEMWNTSWFTEGNIPDMFIAAPEDWTAEQMREWEQSFSQMYSGSDAAKRNLKMLPSGSKPIEGAGFEFGQSFAKWLAVLTCIYMDVQPMEVGFSPDAGLGGAGFSEGQADVNRRKSLKPTANWLARIFTRVIHDWWGAYDLEFAFTALDQSDEKTQHEMDIEDIRNGVKTIDQVREENGDEPFGINGPIMVTGKGLVSYSSLKSLASGEEPVPAGDDPPVPASGTDGGTGDGIPTTTQTDEEPSAGAAKAAEANAYAGGGVPTAAQHREMIRERGNAAPGQAAQQDKKSPTHDLEKAFAANYLSYWAGLSALPAQHEQASWLEDNLYQLKHDSYVRAINRELDKVGASHKHITKITDPAVKQKLRSEARDSAQGIAKTQQHDWQAQKRKIMRQSQDISSNEAQKKLKQWANNRAEWKSRQVGVSESNGPFISAIKEFGKRNKLTAEATYEVVPDACVCAYCQSLVDTNPHTFSDVEAMILPAHPNCWHDVVADYGDVNLDDPWTGGE